MKKGCLLGGGLFVVLWDGGNDFKSEDRISKWVINLKYNDLKGVFQWNNLPVVVYEKFFYREDYRTFSVILLVRFADDI